MHTIRERIRNLLTTIAGVEDGISLLLGQPSQQNPCSGSAAPESTRQPGWIEQPVIPCRPLAARLNENITAIGQAMGDAPDLVIRRFRIGAQGQRDAALLYINGLVDVTVISDNILSALFDASQGSAVSDLSPANAIALVKERSLSVANAAEFHSLEEALH